MRVFAVGIVIASCVACGSSEESAGPNVGSKAVDLSQPEQGVATYYAADGSGNCSFERSPNDLDVAAMNAEEYAESAVCGACVRAIGPKGEVTLRVVDQCPECKKGHLDLSKEAFAKIADVSAGRVSIRWSRVSCSVAGPVEYHFKDGSSQYWTAIQVRNHRLPIAKLEVKPNGGAWRTVKREDYNYFVEAEGVGAGTFSVRITSVAGDTLEDTFASVKADTTVSGAAQFP